MSKEDDYIGSEGHFQIIQAAARKATADQRPPETLDDAFSDFCVAWDDLMKALGVYKAYDRILVFIGRILIRMGWKNV